MKRFKTEASGEGVVFDESTKGEFFAIIYTSDSSFGPISDYVKALDPESAIQKLTQKHFKERGYCSLCYIGLYRNADDYHKHKKPIAEWSDQENARVSDGRIVHSAE